jgi:hypothetical protein
MTKASECAAYSRELRRLKEVIQRKREYAARERTHDAVRRREAVKAKLRAQGLKVSHYSAREISLMVEAQAAQAHPKSPPQRELKQ